MLRLLFCSAAILPIGIIPWMTSEADVMSDLTAPETYADVVTHPNIDALSDCSVGELPVYFIDDLLTTHSAEFITDGFNAADGCGSFDITIIPVLPKNPDETELDVSVQRTAELSAYIEAAADLSDTNVNLNISETPREEEITTLYMNGQAAILRIDPKSRIG